MSLEPAEKRRRTAGIKQEPGSSEAADRWKIHHEIAFLGPEGTYGQQVSTADASYASKCLADG